MQAVRKFLIETFVWMLLLPVGLIIAGSLSNQLVLWANYDKFPVMVNPAKMQVMTDATPVVNPDGSITVKGGHFVILPDGTIMMDPTHCVMTKKTHLNFLADVFDFHEQIESIGDLTIELGQWLWVFAPYLWGAIICLKVYKLTA